MARAVSILAFVFACSLMNLSAQAADHVDSKVPVWELEQKITGWGIQKLSIARDALRMDDPGRGYTILSRAPDWKVIYYSPSRRKIASQPFAKFDGGLARRLTVIMAAFDGADNPSKVPGWIKDGTEKYLGHTCQRWIIRNDIARQRKLAQWKMLNTTEIKVAPQVVSLIASQVAMPNHGSICLFHQNGNSGAHTIIETTKMKRTLARMSIFDAPKGYESTTPEKAMFTNQDFEL